MKVLGILLMVAGGVCTAIGYTEMESWEYKLGEAFGYTNTTPSLLLYGGIAAVVIGLILLVCGGKSGNKA